MPNCCHADAKDMCKFCGLYLREGLGSRYTRTACVDCHRVSSRLRAILPGFTTDSWQLVVKQLRDPKAVRKWLNEDRSAALDAVRKAYVPAGEAVAAGAQAAAVPVDTQAPAPAIASPHPLPAAARMGSVHEAQPRPVQQTSVELSANKGAKRDAQLLQDAAAPIEASKRAHTADAHRDDKGLLAALDARLAGAGKCAYCASQLDGAQHVQPHEFCSVCRQAIDRAVQSGLLTRADAEQKLRAWRVTGAACPATLLPVELQRRLIHFPAAWKWQGMTRQQFVQSWSLRCEVMQACDCGELVHSASEQDTHARLSALQSST